MKRADDERQYDRRYELQYEPVRFVPEERGLGWGSKIAILFSALLAVISVIFIGNFVRLSLEEAEAGSTIAQTRTTKAQRVVEADAPKPCLQHAAFFVGGFIESYIPPGAKYPTYRAYTSPGKEIATLINNGNYTHSKLYRDGQYCYADLVLNGTVDGNSYNVKLLRYRAIGSH